MGTALEVSGAQAPRCRTLWGGRGEPLEVEDFRKGMGASFRRGLDGEETIAGSRQRHDGTELQWC